MKALRSGRDDGGKGERVLLIAVFYLFLFIDMQCYLFLPPHGSSEKSVI